MRETWAEGFQIDPAMLRAWGDPEFAVTDVKSGTLPGEMKVEVSEPGGGLDTEYATWTVRKESGAWVVSGWFMGRLSEDPSRKAGGSSADNPMVETALRGAVGTFLQMRMGGDIEGMKRAATAEFLREQPEVFRYKPQAFTGFEVGSVRAEGDQWAVSVDEQWTTGPEKHDYVVVVRDGTYVLDQER
jgi:hypothetical protein